MRGFSAPPSKSITLTRDSESITFTVHALPPLFRTRLRLSWPAPADEASEDVRIDYVMRRAFIIAAEGLRCSEEGVPSLPVSGDPQVWLAYSQALLEMFNAAGLTDPEIREITAAAVELSESSSVEALETEGNG